jgi:hypothetical protein
MNGGEAKKQERLSLASHHFFISNYIYKGLAETNNLAYLAPYSNEKLMFCNIDYRCLSSLKDERLSASGVLAGPAHKSFDGDTADFVEQVTDTHAMNGKN